MYISELKDILTAELRVFLEETLAREKLSPVAEEQRLMLLVRLSQIVHQNQITKTGPYLDMSKASTLPVSKVTELNCYEPMSDTPGVSKCGKLGRRERFLWLGQTRKCWGVLLNQNLSLYSSQNESRPHTVLRLDGYQARQSTAKAGPMIELFCPGNKTYQFIVQDKNELESWIEAINECGRRSLPPPPPPLPMTPPPSQEVYDTPDARIRPVTPTKQDYEAMHGSFYDVIDPKKAHQEVLYKNVGLNEDENNYYNLISRGEDIYQTINETEKNIDTVQNRIQTIIRALEAKRMGDTELYEPVDLGQEPTR